MVTHIKFTLVVTYLDQLHLLDHLQRDEDMSVIQRLHEEHTSPDDILFSCEEG